jgi:DNA-binding CsgD family transcriptional regulator/tetratricopeptide (TPR) repeat protein
VSRQFPDAYVGRLEELAALRSILERVRSGHPQTVLVEGPAGMGKTALVEQFLRGEEDIRLLRASGEHWETLVPYGVVDQLMRAAGASATRLFSSRLRAFPAEEPISVGSSLLELLEDLEEKNVVVLVLEDAHWTDTDSLRAVLFALRRLVSERVLTLLTVREEEAARLPDGLRRLAAGVSGLTLRLPPLLPLEIQGLAAALGVAEFSGRVAARLHSHTGGNPLYVRALLEEVPAGRWRTWEPVLPAPRAFAEQVAHRLEACGPAVRRLIEAASVLGATAALSTVAVVAEVEDPLPALDEAIAVGLLQSCDEPGSGDVDFPHPLVQAAVHEHLAPGRRVRLHLAAAKLVDDDGTVLRHRVAAAQPPDEGLAEDLSSFAEQQAAAGAWAGAASALVQASRLSVAQERREQWLLRALDAMIGSGDLIQASVFAEDVADLGSGPLHDAALGYLAVLRGRPAEAEALLAGAWSRCDPVSDARLAAVVAQRWALHSVGRLLGSQVVKWTSQALELAPPEESIRVEAGALLGLGLGWSGRVPDGVAAYERTLYESDDPDRAAALERLQMPLGWLRLASDDVEEARSILAASAPSQLRRGAVRIAVWAYVWLSRSEFLLGSWDRAAAAAERAVSLLEETGHEWLRPLARWVAGAVPAARGEWAAAEEHARLGAAQAGDYELMIVAGSLGRAQVAAAQGDPEAVLRALEPVMAIEPRDGLDEPGFWPWQDLYADALVSTGRLKDAAEFLTPHEELASARGRRSSVAMLARVRGRLEAAAGRPEAAEAAFQRALEEVQHVPVPFCRAMIELAHGQVLRRQGHRRAAAEELQAAHGRFAELRAGPYLERCERELSACGLTPSKRHDFDPSALTAQELAVARLVAAGMSNRQVAAELFVSIKTVQFHLTHIYSKLHLGSRTELAAYLREDVQPADGKLAAGGGGYVRTGGPAG